MKFLFSNKLASTISFAGKKDKVSFSSLKLHKLILGNLFTLLNKI